MRVSIDISIVPLGVGMSLSGYVAECINVFREFDLQYSLHAFGTNVEGDWDTVFQAVKTCHERLHAMNAPRLYTVIKVGTRTDKEQSLSDKINSVQKHLNMNG